MSITEAGWPFGSRQVDQAAFAEQVNLAATLQRVFIYQRANFALAARQFFQRGNINFHVEVAGVANHRAVFHAFKMLAANHALVSGNGDVDVAFFYRLLHGHDAEAVHHRFDALAPDRFR